MTVSTSPNPDSMTLHWQLDQLEADRGGSIYTSGISKHYKSGHQPNLTPDLSLTEKMSSRDSSLIFQTVLDLHGYILGPPLSSLEAGQILHSGLPREATKYSRLPSSEGPFTCLWASFQLFSVPVGSESSQKTAKELPLF